VEKEIGSAPPQYAAAGRSVRGKTGEDYYAKREGEPTVYAIEEFSYKQIDKRLSDFLEFPSGRIKE